MAKSNDTSQWRQLREFPDVDLMRSFVLSWHVEADTLLVDVDVCLTREHPFYEKPRPAEKACIRPARIEFPYCEALGRDGGSEGELVEIAANLGHGAISNFRRLSDARYEMSGEFGTVFIDAERPVFKLVRP